jgi:hypothetical protein
MSARRDRHAEGLLERITSSTGFLVVFALSVVIVAPTLLVGVLGTILAITMASPRLWVLPAMLVAGGFLGMLGWFRAHRHAHEMWHGRIEATLVLLAVGVAAAAGGTAMLAYEAAADIRSWSESPVPWFGAAVVAAHVVVILRALGWMRRLAREYAERTGIRFDGLPVMFLLLGIAQLAGVILIATRL